MGQEINNLEQLLDQIYRAAKNREEVSLGAVIQEIGSRSFGPLLLTAGLITLTPVIGDIPGVPTIMGILILLSSGQLLFRRKHFWMPSWLLERSVAQNKLTASLKRLRPAGRFVDRFLRPRLTALTRGTGIYFIAASCVGIAAAMPVMEVVPFSANIAGIALTAFGLSLITHDGLLALLAFLFTFITFGIVIYNLILS
ncbi:MAG: exopolysaccharide biosynthesis protein [Desulfobacterales bacterium]